MRSYLINKNICTYYWLRKGVARSWLFGWQAPFEKAIPCFWKGDVHSLM